MCRVNLNLPTAGGGPNVQVFNSEFGSRTVPPPVIKIELANSTAGCRASAWNCMERLVTWFKFDWNADARVWARDLLDFLADYFVGAGDCTGEGATSVNDVFRFLADWFAGV